MNKSKIRILNYSDNTVSTSKKRPYRWALIKDIKNQSTVDELIKNFEIKYELV